MNFYFILVLYKCNLKDSASFNTILHALKYSGKKATFYIYDNSPNSQTINEENIDFVYVHDSNNSGLSKAYNLGAMYAFKNNFEWITLLDQDTSFPIDYISKLECCIIKNHNAKMFASKLILNNNTPFSPTKYRWKRGHSVDLEYDKFYSLYDFSPVNSGLTIELKSFLEVGGYNEDVFLDFADFQFIEKFRKTYSFFYLMNVTAVQDFSNDETNINKLNDRFILYCQCANNCKKENILEKIQYFYTVTRHCLGLIIKSKNLIFLKTYYKFFIS